MENFPSWFETLQKSHPIVPISTVQISRTSCFIVRSFPVFLMELKIFWVILSHEYRWLSCRRHNIHHFKQCLLLSCVASFEDWSNIFRTRSFTLCKNDLDFNDKSDSMTVLESIHIIVINNKSVRVPCEPTGWLFINMSHRSDLHRFIRFPLLRRPFFVSIPLWVAWWASVLYKSPHS